MNTTALAIVQPSELDTIQRTAKLLAASGYFATSDGITGMAQVAAKILAGRELGFGPFAAVNGIHIIQGKPTVGANLMAAAVRSHPRYDYKVKELTDKACVLEFYDNGQLAGLSSFTLAEAEKAELSTGKNAATWRKFARNMLFARAMSNGVRWYAPDIFSGNAVYVPEELGAEVDGDGEIIEATIRRVDPANDVDFGTPKQLAHNVPETPQQGPAAIEAVTVNGDALFDVEAQGTPPHNHFWGVGQSVFGPDWNIARGWLLKKWTEKVTPDKVRSSSSKLSDDEKMLLAEYMQESALGLQKAWAKQRAVEIAKVQQPVAEAA